MNPGVDYVRALIYLTSMGLLIRYLLLLLLFTWIVRKIKSYLKASSGDNNTSSPGSSANFCPYTTLGIPKNATQEQIKTAYKNALSNYHPDKVEHLGEELKKVAKEKTEAITRAYETLS